MDLSSLNYILSVSFALPITVTRHLSLVLGSHEGHHLLVEGKASCIEKVVVLAMKGIGYEYKLFFWQQHKRSTNSGLISYKKRDIVHHTPLGAKATFS